MKTTYDGILVAIDIVVVDVAVFSRALNLPARSSHMTTLEKILVIAVIVNNYKKANALRLLCDFSFAAILFLGQRS